MSLIVQEMREAEERIRELEEFNRTLRETLGRQYEESLSRFAGLEQRIAKAKVILEADVMSYKGGPRVQMDHALEALEGK